MLYEVITHHLLRQFGQRYGLRAHRIRTPVSSAATPPFDFAQGRESFDLAQDREPVERPVERQMMRNNFV